MAAPVKAFIDPVKVSLLFNNTELAGNSYLNILDFYRTTTYVINSFAKIENINIIRRTSEIPISYYAEIPPPPMGRLILATFSSIYKEKAKVAPGQLYPRYY